MTQSTPLEVVRRVLATADVEDLVLRRRPVSTEDSGYQAVLPSAGTVVGQVKATAFRSSQLDVAMAIALHPALAHLPRRLLLDVRLWTWLCIGPLRDFVSHRWCGVEFGALPDSISPSTAKRFAGRSSLQGFARNALARLYFAVDVLGDQELVEQALTRQDLFTGIFERRLGLHPTLARASVEVLADRPEDDRRVALRRLNEILLTTAVETFDDKAARGIVTDLLP